MSDDRGDAWDDRKNRASENVGPRRPISLSLSLNGPMRAITHDSSKQEILLGLQIMHSQVLFQSHSTGHLHSAATASHCSIACKPLPKKAPATIVFLIMQLFATCAIPAGRGYAAKFHKRVETQIHTESRRVGDLVTGGACELEGTGAKELTDLPTARDVT